MTTIFSLCQTISQYNSYDFFHFYKTGSEHFTLDGRLVNFVHPQWLYYETSNISHLHSFQPSSNSSICRAPTFAIWETSLQILYLLLFLVPANFIDLNPAKLVSSPPSLWNLSLVISALTTLSSINSYSLYSVLCISYPSSIQNSLFS